MGPYSNRRAMSVLFLVFALAAPRPAIAADTYVSPRDFLAQSFDGAVPAPSMLWIDRALKARMRQRLGRVYPGFRLRYWTRSGRTAWILDAIGKYEPITTGIVVDNGRISRVAVLVYRESHGWEVRHAFFTNRFVGAKLGADDNLTQDIDNISGATLSVNALKWQARLALLLHERALGRARESR